MSKKVTESGDGAVVKPMSNLNASLYEAFRRFASRGNFMQSKDLSKWCKDAKILGKYMNKIHLDVSFFKVKKKGANGIDFKNVLLLMNELVVKYIDDTWIPHEEALTHLKYKLSCAQPTLHYPMLDTTIGAVDRLTNSKNYTGCQKARFEKLEQTCRKSKYEGWVTHELSDMPRGSSTQPSLASTPYPPQPTPTNAPPTVGTTVV